MRRSTLLIAPAIVCAWGSLAAAATAAPPRLSVSSDQQLTVRGARFVPREHVRIVVMSGSSVRTRWVWAGTAGAFRVAFPTIAASGCQAVLVRAFGSHGSRATARLLPECPNGPAG